MKTTLAALSLMLISACGQANNNSSVKDAPQAASAPQTTAAPAALTASSFQGSYTGVDGSGAVCKIQVQVAPLGLLHRSYMVVHVADSSFTDKASDVNSALANLGSNDAVTLTTSVTTGVFSSDDSTLQMFLTNGALSGIHFQEAKFSGGFIQGQWNVIDCQSLNKDASSAPVTN